MAEANKSLRMCEIVFKTDTQELKRQTIDKIKAVISEKNSIRYYSYIIHDKDIYTADDEEANPSHKEGALKPSHIHLLLKFEDNQPQKLNSVAGWFDIQPNFIQRVKGNWVSAVLYQTHRNALDKYQYSSDEVTCNIDYDEIYTSYIKKQTSLKKKDAIIQKILTGEIKEYDKTTEIDNVLLVKYAREIREAFNIRQERQLLETDRDTQVIFITGDAGAGKTTFAKKIATEKGLPYYISSSSNDVLDGYAQQPCIILDDLRPSSLGLSDLLKLLDNWNNSSVKSRYKNKLVNCKLIIITSILNIDNFYNGVFKEQEEPAIQLKRRCKLYITMTSKLICTKVWDNLHMRYETSLIYNNTLLDDYIKETDNPEEDRDEYVKNTLPFLNNDINEVMTNMKIFPNL